MDLLKIGHFYINHILSVSQSQQGNLPGNNINVLLLDDHTASIISIISSQSELLNNNIFLIDKLSNIANRDKLRHLNCIVFVGPSAQSINYLCDELKFPKYKRYNVFFSNFLKKSQLEKIAESDDLELISHIQEIFWDYLIVNSSLFQSRPLVSMNGGDDDSNALSLLSSSSSALSSNQLLSILLSLKMKPIIRFESNSKLALRTANEVFYELTNHNSNAFSIFNGFPKSDTKPLLLILDRKNDPLTPLLTPWTYQSMIHEYLGIDKNIVDLTQYMKTESPSTTTTTTTTKHDDDIELTKIILNVENDKFFAESMYLNFADLSDKISALVNVYKSKTNSSNSLNSLDDLKNFLQDYPEFKKLSHNVNKHITITTELNNKIGKNNLWEVSEVEQYLSVGGEHDFSQHAEDFNNVRSILVNGKFKKTNTGMFNIQENFKVKLVMVYALRYETYKQNQLSLLVDILKQQQVNATKIQLIDFVLKYAGYNKRLYNNNNNNNNNNNEETFSASLSSSTSQAPGFNFNNSTNVNTPTNSNLSIFTPSKNTNNLISSLKKLGDFSNPNKHGGNNDAIDDSFDYEDANNTSIYMQHRPRLLHILHNVLTKRLQGSSYPVLNPYSKNNNGNNNNGAAAVDSGINHINYSTSSIANEKFQDIVVHVIGGITYEESRVIGLLNEKYKAKGIRLVIGSNTIVSSDTFMQQLTGEMLKDSQKNDGRGLLGKNEKEDRLLNILNGGSLEQTGGGGGGGKDSFFGDNLL
ncbi:Vps45 protein [Saccharomycopsis crataegensis]|uniref:Vps45 protein n=1 Tax=Saccharomycopsis crataegensis TaxID=43959 RepID=A0AAV5QNC9_9ASCO|nr:Vps45 protein [Saccharomycopsis crataegensis]